MRYGLVGYSGRMGREIAALFGEAGHELAATLDEGGRRVDASPEVVVDFSLPSALPATLEMCREHGSALVIGTTGFSAEDESAIRELGANVPVVHSSNFGPGVNLLAMIMEDYAKIFADWEMEIEEIHHNKKRDAPSGTAIMLMRAAGRNENNCPWHSLRLGNIPGDHTVFLSNGDELMTLSHRTVNRGALARGALTAAEFAAGAEPGYYTFRDVLRLKK